ncbi:unnamed protein product [Ectocarpus fasciculatus]
MLQAKIEGIRKGRMGTIEFEMKVVPKMRKAQNFTVYPLSEDKNKITIQSKNRIASIDMRTGQGKICNPPRTNSSFADLQFGNPLSFQVIEVDRVELIKSIAATASSRAGNNGIMVTDNSKASYLLKLLPTEGEESQDLRTNQ